MTKELFSGAELVVKALSALKVKYLFGYPGGTVLDIYDALFRQDDVEHILVRHEQAATHKLYYRHSHSVYGLYSYGGVIWPSAYRPNW